MQILLLYEKWQKMFLMIWPYILRYYSLSAEIQTLLLAVCGAVSVKTVFKSEQKSINCPSSAYHDSDWQTLLVAINMARYQHARQGRDMWIVNCEWAWAMLVEQCSMNTYFPTKSCNTHPKTVWWCSMYVRFLLVLPNEATSFGCTTKCFVRKYNTCMYTCLYTVVFIALLDGGS